jgi:transposase
VGDARDDRITELGGELASKVARIAEQDQRIAEQAEEIAALKTQVAELLGKLNQNSSNSHKPPSSDPPGNRQQRRAKDKQQRKRGGQKGHKGSGRELLPPEQVDEFVDHFPHECESCWKPLPETHDPDATRYQFTEVPPIRPHTTEHRRHAVTCPHCKYVTRAPHDANKIPASPFGPRLMSLMALLTGYYHLSRRKAQGLLADVLGVSVSLGAISNVEERVSNAVKPVVAEVWNRVGEDEVKHADGTSWYQAGLTLCLWTIATKTATVFKIISDGSAKTLAPLFGALQGILVSDRATALNFWAMDRRQICFAHLLRKFVSFSERDGPAGAFGNELLDYTGIIFEYWHNYKDDKLSRNELVSRMAPVRQQMEALLVRVVDANIKGVSGSCANMLAFKDALWTFVDNDGVDPTNNHAERELRAFVLWRKRSFGTQSERGNRFAERLMTIAHTARKQNKNVLAFLTACCEPQTPTPSLFDAELADGR